MPERSNGAVSKTVVVLCATVGSNPTLSAIVLVFVMLSKKEKKEIKNYITEILHDILSSDVNARHNTHDITKNIHTAVEKDLEQLDQPLELIENQVEYVPTDVDIAHNKKLAEDINALRDSALEQRYRSRAYFFRNLVRKPYLLSVDDISSLLDQAADSKQLSEEEIYSLSMADLILKGLSHESDEEVYLVVEVSVGIGISDVERAFESAATLHKLGFKVLPIVAGITILPSARQLAQEIQVVFLACESTAS